MSGGFLKIKGLKTLFLSSLGSALEYYDFILFVIFAQYISFHFYPEDLSKFWKDFFVYSTFASGYLARPLGGIIMAHFGDRYGRKKIFILSVALIVIPTFSLSFLPTYATLGIFAPLFLVLVRLFQGIAVGGEVPCSWVFLSEHTPRKYRGIFLGFLTASISTGILLGSIISLLLHQLFSLEVMREWAWRIPFFLGGIFGIISIGLRRHLSETPIFQQFQYERQIVQIPLLKVFKSFKKDIILAMLSAFILAGSVMSLTLFMPKFIGEILKWQAFQRDLLQIAGLIAYFVGCVLSGALADKIGIVGALRKFSLFFLFTTFFLCLLLYGETKYSILISGCYLFACVAAGIASLCPIMMLELFEPKVRLSGISFSYNISQAVVGALTPSVIFLLHNSSQTSSSALSFLIMFTYFIWIPIVGLICLGCFKVREKPIESLK